MTRFEFINTLRTAMHGLPADKVERIVADHERRFEQGAAAGKSEEDIARELGDPWDIAAHARIPARERAVSNAAKAGRVFISGLGLTIFNLFMIIPAFLYGVLLTVMYIAGIALYFGGIVMTASNLAGVDELAFRIPFDEMVAEHPASRAIESLDRGGRVRMTIDDNGILIVPDNDTPPRDHGEAKSVAASSAPQASVPAQASSASMASAASAMSPATKTVTVEPDDGRAMRTLRSIGIILGGIVLLLFCGVATRYTWIGLKRYVQMNVSTLRNA